MKHFWRFTAKNSTAAFTITSEENGDSTQLVQHNPNLWKEKTLFTLSIRGRVCAANSDTMHANAFSLASYSSALKWKKP